ncbi:MAG: tetratricopeptide repeat protein [Pyrinomonadaceae bacterium]
MADGTDSQKSSNQSGRIAVASGLLVILLVFVWSVARSGYASLLTAYAAQTSQISLADSAVRLGASNPDAHYVRASILETSDLSGAIAEHYQAVLARPDDYVLWLSLARASELNGETAASVAAARQAAQLAPEYAEPHYQLGNILLRAGQTDEAFKELRLAGASNPTLMPGVIDLAWRVSGGNVQFVVAAIKPTTSAGYQRLAFYFAQRKEVEAAIAMYAAAGSEAAHYRRAYVHDLIATKQFKAAARLWAVGQQSPAAPGVLTDPGFEKESDLAEWGFAWRLGDQPQGFHLSLDGANPREGNSSLKVEFDGASEPASPVITQLVLVEPRTRYRLHFAVRSEGIVSGGLPLVVVIGPDANKVLGQSEQLMKATEGWREYTIDFELGPAGDAVQIALQRQPCNSSPCPIFGRLWLDAFSLQKL